MSLIVFFRQLRVNSALDCFETNGYSKEFLDQFFYEIVSVLSPLYIPVRSIQGLKDALDRICQGRVKFLNFRTPENFAVNNLKFKQSGRNLRVICENIAKGIAKQ